MRQTCRTTYYWTNWKSKRHGVVIQMDVTPSDGYGRLPYPHVLGGACFCHPATEMAKEGYRVYIHDHPMTEAE